MFERMAGRLAIDQLTYEELHKGTHEGSVVKPRGEFALVDVEEEGVREGGEEVQRVHRVARENRVPDDQLPAHS